jgi:hypothetical protein
MQEVYEWLPSKSGVTNPRAAGRFPAREIHHTYTKDIYFIMAKVVNTNVLKKFHHPQVA